MTIARTNNMLDVALDTSRTFLHHKLNEFKKRRARRKLYRDTFSELASLSDRALKDLGLPRSSLKRIAMEAAYDC